MKIEVIGSRGVSYSSAEDLVREFGPRFVRDGHKFTAHVWATEETLNKGIKSEKKNGIIRVFHKTPGGKITGQLFVAIKGSIHAAFSDCDLVYYMFIQNGIFSWIPKLFGKKIFINLDGIMWRDPKWPWGIRHLFFPLGAYLCMLIGNRVITDSVHMQELYKKKFKTRIDWAGYGCVPESPKRKDIELSKNYPEGYYLIMSRITPHNLTDIMVDGFIKSNSQSHLLVAGHITYTKWFYRMRQRSEGKNVTFLGLIKDQDELTQIILNARAYLHGHSLGGINPALVRVTGLDTPAICINTPFNREVVEYPNHKLQAVLFDKNSDSVANAINEFENKEKYYKNEAKLLGVKVRKTMSWENIYRQYNKFFIDCFK